MKIYSWNVFYGNKNFDSIVSFINGLDFDVIALQEVPQELLEKLRALPFEIAYGSDWMYKDTSGNDVPIYLVTLSKLPIRNSHTIPFPEELYAGPLSPRAQLFRTLLGWATFFRGRTGLLTEVALRDTEKYQVLNMHLSVIAPEGRRREFETAIQGARKDIPLIVCGDFNIFEHLHATVFNWLMGGTLGDVIFVKRERKWFENKFKELGLKNPLRRLKTHSVARSQIDHILVPQEMLVVQKEVLKKKYGSDHNLIMIELHVKGEKE